MVCDQDPAPGKDALCPYLDTKDADGASAELVQPHRPCGTRLRSVQQKLSRSTEENGKELCDTPERSQQVEQRTSSSFVVFV